MFDVNQFVVIGRYTKIESHNNKSITTPFLIQQTF